MGWQKVVVIDLGGGYAGQVARIIRAKKVYSEIVPAGLALKELQKKEAQAIIVCGGTGKVEERVLSLLDKEVFNLGIPVMIVGQGVRAWAFCNSFQNLIVESVNTGENQLIEVKVVCDNNLKEVEDYLPSFINLSLDTSYSLSGVPGDDFIPLAYCQNNKALIFYSQRRKTLISVAYPVNKEGEKIFDYFLFHVASLDASWTPASFVEDAIAKIKKDVPSDAGAVCGLSGGVDSAVSALLVQRALGDRLTCILVDHGFLRYKEAQEVVDTYKNKYKLNLIFVDAANEFLDKLKGVIDPEQKRQIIGEHFIRVFEREARNLGDDIQFLVQGTIYPDIVESLSPSGEVIKSHHNVGGLPEKMSLQLIEPVKELFKDEVRSVGLELGLPSEVVWRQPFPGPGLAVRVLGEITQEKLDIARKANYILDQEVNRAGLNREIWQYFAVLPSVRSVGVSGDQRTYAYPIVIRAVNSRDAMTAQWYPFPHEILDRLSRRIVEEVPGVNRVVYDITSKPPATIEWE